MQNSHDAQSLLLLMAFAVLVSGCLEPTSTVPDDLSELDSIADLQGEDGQTDLDATHTDATSPPDLGDLPDITDVDASDTAADGLTDESDLSSPFAYTVDPPTVALPFTVVGGAVPDGILIVREEGGTTSLSSIGVVSDPAFEIAGDLSPLSGFETRALTVRYLGPTDSPTLVAGVATLTIDGFTRPVRLGAVIGRPGLPSTSWRDDTFTTRSVTIPLETAPFPDGVAPWSDRSVLIVVPVGLSDTDGVDVVTHLHGHNALLSTTIPAQHLVEQFGLSGRDAVLIIPQGPVNAASGDFGKLDNPDGFAALVDDVLAILYREKLIAWPAIGGVVLTAHSGGYNATANIVEVGGYPVQSVNLFDSLYARSDTFQAFAEAGGRLRSLYTSGGGTLDDNVALRAALQGAGYSVAEAFDDEALADNVLVIAFTASTHSGCLSDTLNTARLLQSSGLPKAADAPPELLSILSSGNGEAVVSWRRDLGSPDAMTGVEGSLDGVSWRDLGESRAGTLTVSAMPWIRVRTVFHDDTGNTLLGAPSDTYGGDGATWLVVDGFDRVLGGSFRQRTHPFAARVGSALGAPFSTASNEAIASGRVALTDYSHVLWLLGDESVADVTLDAAERAALETYLAAGGKLIVSGSELGYATDPVWLASTLHVQYLADDANTNLASGYTFGVAYEEDYPDVLGGDTVLWTYSTGGGAAIGWSHAIIAVGFPLETLADADLQLALAELVGWLTL